MFIQTEQTPNPATLKFLPGCAVMPSGTADFTTHEAARRSPLAERLFELDEVAGVFLGADFITVTKGGDGDWHQLKPAVLAAIMEHFTAGRPVVDGETMGDAADATEEDDEIVSQIKELLETRVRPAVAQDGGDIIFHDFEDGVVYLHMQGLVLGLSQFDRNAEGRDREHAAALHPRSDRGSRGLSRDPAAPLKILALDTAGSACSVAVGCGGHVLAAEHRALRHGHAEALLPMVDAAMREAGLDAAALDAVAVTLGPGGFTGIRAGLAAAHGIAFAAGARLVGVSSFAAVIATLPSGPANGAAHLVALDSRRADLYVQLFGPDREALTEPQSIPPDRLPAWIVAHAAALPLVVAGDAAEAAAAFLSGHAGIVPMPGSAPDARGVLAAADGLLQRGEAGSPRPLYLRAPDVTVPADGRAPRRAASGDRIAPLPPAAAAPLAALHRACFPDESWDAAALAQILALAGSFGYLAWAGGTPTGFVVARDLGDDCEILSLGVVPGWRGRGIGARLLQAAFAEARRRDLASCVLEVATDNAAARRLYGRLGFGQVGRRRRYYRRPTGMADALILRLNLGRIMNPV